MTAIRSVPLSNVAKIDRTSLAPEKIQGGTAYLGLEHIESGGKILGAQKVESGELKSSKFQFTSEHILYGKLRPYLAKIALPDFDGICSTDIIPVLPGPDIDRKYLLYFLRQGSMVEYANSRSSGANLPRLSPKELANFQIPLPSLQEQKRIAKILDAADALRAKRRESLGQLDALLQSAFLDLFGDPVSNPMNWEVARFGELGECRLGKMLDKGRQVGEIFPYLANFNVRWDDFEISELREMAFSEPEKEEFSLRDGDLLVCEGGEVGRAAIWRGNGTGIYFQKALHRVRLNADLALPEFALFYLWFMAKNGGFGDYTNSATIAHLTGVKLKGLPVPLPPIEKQKKFQRIF
jgi:type I restriction enzyme S subunit